MAGNKGAAVELRNAVSLVVEGRATQGATNFQGGFINLYRDTVHEVVDGVVYNEMIDASIWFN